MSSNLKIAVVGATGTVGEVILDILSEHGFKHTQISALASKRSEGNSVNFGRRELTIQCLDDFDFCSVDYGLFSAGSSISKKYAPLAVAAGCTVIDNSSAFRLDEAIPLIVPEVNGALLKDFKRPGIIANPNCSTIQMVVALESIQRKYGIRRIDVATYQAVSGAGRKAQEELAKQTMQKMSFQDIECQQFSQQMVFNVLPQIDVLQENGYSGEEMKMHWETRKIFSDESIVVNATAVRVPVFFGHAEAIHLETVSPFELDDVEQLLRAAPGVVYTANLEGGEHPTPAVHAAGEDPVFVGRLRRDHSRDLGMNLWVVADNIRKGAALNAIQIMQVLETARAEG
ncbi:MAG: aspartate-semialdehyde dehydrogenase [Xanthomonadales bacterium]|nr:aspartate-semialdehyde dehydrogenase [Xanthomonadales bacterium]